MRDGHPHGSVPRRTSSLRARCAAFLELTKPRIIELLLVTTVPSMVLAHGGIPPIGLVVATVLGGTLAAGGANALNMVIDRDVDRVMARTSGRPLVTGRVSPAEATLFALGCEVVAFLILWRWVNLLAALLAFGAFAFYVVVYTLWLKRRSRQNIVIGGAAGAAPTLIGWAAVTGELALPAWILFLVVFLWTPPHFWALALRYRDDYSVARIPMLPAVAGTASVTRSILAYAAAVVACSLLLPFASETGLIYSVVALGSGVSFVWSAFELHRRPTASNAMRVFAFSITYLALLFGAIGADVLLRA